MSSYIDPFVVRKPCFRDSSYYTYSLKFRDRNNKHHSISTNISHQDHDKISIIESICTKSSVALLYVNSKDVFINELARVKLKVKNKAIELYYDNMSYIVRKFNV